MRLTLTVLTAAATPLDVLVHADPEATVGAVKVALHDVIGASGSHTSRLCMAEVPLEDDTSLAESGLVDGAILTVAGPGTGAGPAPAAAVQLHVVGGPAAGEIIDLSPGTFDLSTLDLAMTPGGNAQLVVSAAGAVLTDPGAAAGVRLDGQAVTDSVAVAPGQILALGDSRLTIVPTPVSDAAVEAADPGTLAFLRPPRLLPPRRVVRVVQPERPQDHTKRRFPLATVLAPLVVGVVMAVVTKHPLYLLFAVASPLMAIVNAVADRRAGAREHRHALERYDAELATATAELRAALAAETLRRRAEHPDPAALLQIAVLPTRRLWERRRTDPDSLVLRVGTGSLAADVVLERAARIAERWSEIDRTGGNSVRDVPVTVSLAEAGVIGLAGPAKPLYGVLRWLVLQLAVHHPPRDVALTLLAPHTGHEWSWVRWLPHARPSDPDGPVALIGNDAETVAARVAELVALVKARREQVRELGRVDPAYFPAHVLVVDGFRELRTTPGLAGLLEDGPQFGVYTLCADAEERFLPESASALVLLSPANGGQLTLRRTGLEPVEDVLVDGVPVAIATSAARALAPLRDVSGDDAAILPESIRLLDVLDLEPPTADAVRRRWSEAGRTSSFVLGAGLAGPFRLDLARDGPHGLIAGTTGAGKSELLQSIIASLAVVNRPDALNLVLVDYKGGSAFKDCVELPHTVGMVTDLDAHLVERALTSLGAELRGREQRLADAGVKDIQDYVELRAREPRRPPMPALLLVIDEFASMARDLPDFVKGLVSIAQRGRSLGIHLLLATQRPSGVVSPEIRANTNLRIALRVTDSADSADVVDAPDAARIPKSAPGRAVARLGHGALVPFQAGRVGGRRPGHAPETVPRPTVMPLGWPELGRPAPPVPSTQNGSHPVLTDLAVLVAAVRAAAEAEQLPPQRSPWLPALPDHLLLADLDLAVASPLEPGGVPALPLGLLDLPASQRRVIADFDLARDGHLLVIGSPRSGRSQLLRTLAGSIADRVPTRDLHVFGLDCGNGALLALQDLPHCGAVVSRTQTERAVRLLARLQGEVERRQGVLAASGAADVGEQRRRSAPDERLPHLLLLIDRWEGFIASFGELDAGRPLDAVLALLREGASVGVHVVLAGDRSLASGRIASLTDSKLVLRLNDRSDYTLVGLNPRQLPDIVPPGRAYFSPDGTEMQIALLAEDDPGTVQAAALADLAASATARDAAVPPHLRPFRVDALPARFALASALALRPSGSSTLHAVVGVGGDELQAWGPDFASGGSSFVVAGPARSGRSTALVAMARSLLAAGTQVAVAAPRSSPLRELAGEPGVLGVVTDPMAGDAQWRVLLARAGDQPLVLLLDDAELLRDVPASEVFRDLVKGTLGPSRFLVFGGGAEGLCLGLSGWQVEARKARQGILLSPQGGSDGELIGVRLPRSAVGQPVQPGRGLLHLGDSRLITVTVPLP